VLKVRLDTNIELSIPLSEIEFTFSRSSGPGGQNVNKVNSKATLRWNPVRSSAMSPFMKGRFLAVNANKLTSDGDILFSSDRFRDQLQNVDECLSKLKELIRATATPPKPRKDTKPTFGSKKRNEKTKRTQKDKKQNRGRVDY
jgi:ribosome-associated protein